MSTSRRWRGFQNYLRNGTGSFSRDRCWEQVSEMKICNGDSTPLNPLNQIPLPDLYVDVTVNRSGANESCVYGHSKKCKYSILIFYIFLRQKKSEGDCLDLNGTQIWTRSSSLSWSWGLSWLDTIHSLTWQVPVWDHLRLQVFRTPGVQVSPGCPAPCMHCSSVLPISKSFVWSHFNSP